MAKHPQSKAEREGKCAVGWRMQGV